MIMNKCKIFYYLKINDKNDENISVKMFKYIM